MRSLALLFVLVCGACSPRARPFVPELRYAESATPRCPTQDAPLRTTAPAISGLPPPVIPPVAAFSLDNGMKVVVVTRTSFPAVAAQLVVDTTGASDGDVGGLRASLLASTYLTPAGESVATRRGCDVTACSVSSAAPSDELDDLLERVAKSTRPPSPTAEPYARRLAAASAALRANHDSLQANVHARLFGASHAYGDASPKAWPTLEETRLLRDRAIVPGAATLVLAGDVTVDAARVAVLRAFGTWSGAAPATRHSPAPPVPGGPRFVAYPRPDLSQLHGMLAGRGPTPRDSDAPAFHVLGEVLGSSLSSEAFTRVRQEAGAAYSVGGDIEWYPDASVFRLAAGFERAKAVDGMKALLAVVADARSASPSPDRVEEAKAALIGNLRSRIQTAAGLASVVAGAVMLGLPPEAELELASRIQAVTPAQVHAAAVRYLDQEALCVVFVGDAAFLGRSDALGLGWPVRTNAYGEVQR